MFDIFELYRRQLIGLPLSMIWRGYGSAIFLELDAAGPADAKGRLEGRFTIMIEWSWRISSPTEVLTGSWGEEEKWPSCFESLMGKTVTDVRLFGSPPELAISLSDDLQVTSYMTAEGSPSWAILDKPQYGKAEKSISVEDGQVVEAVYHS